MDARVATVIELMHQLLAEDLSVRSLSGTVNLSPSRLRQLFNKETGRSPAEFLRSLRLERAEHLLRTTFLSIKEVASLSGANDVSHFVRAFKKRYALTPTHFRAQNGATASPHGVTPVARRPRVYRSG